MLLHPCTYGILALVDFGVEAIGCPDLSTCGTEWKMYFVQSALYDEWLQTKGEHRFATLRADFAKGLRSEALFEALKDLLAANPTEEHKLELEFVASLWVSEASYLDKLKYLFDKPENFKLLRVWAPADPRLIQPGAIDGFRIHSRTCDAGV